MIPVTTKEIRQQMGLSQSKFASYFGLSTRTVQGWEIGKKEPAYLPDLLIRILNAEQRVAELEKQLESCAGNASKNDSHGFEN
jgi:DNA-binding transcriptional regulator YiaG